MRDMDRWLGDGGMPVIEQLGAAFTAYGDGWTDATWTPTPLACNPGGFVQAGVHAVILDAAMNFAINAALDTGDRTRATLEMKTETMRMAQGGADFTVRGEVVRMAKQVAYAEAKVTNGNGELISRSTGTFLLQRRTSG